MSYSPDIKDKARLLRLEGHSFREIGEELLVPRSTVRCWVFEIHLSKVAKERLNTLKTNGQKKAHALMKKKERS